MLLLFFAGIQWVGGKFFGVRYGSASTVYQENRQYKEALQKLSKYDPVLVEKAIESCKTKKYALTHQNIVSEAMKIDKKESGEPSTQEKIFNKIQSVADTFKLNDSSSKIRELDKLNKLRKDGVLTETEFNTLKEKIMRQ